ncbi:Gfo/Idh/MocA family protein [Gilliamella sp. wkB112]|uniref:Gfo/Idh/MocA family protein n=1 Tax=Gilliamella sp. wkB112 TaxID=3120257 RepID=UPI00080D9C52|nr:Gfo/Idh/MocA family oxidoreductase [Gilliamella apicola]OCG01681.1 hypothetical protein A9G12_11920 [Gilliamella apicola]
MSNLRIGIIGLGSMGKGHFINITENINGATITAVCDIDTSLQDKFIYQYSNDVLFFTDPNDLIKSNKVDAIIIASPDEYHAEQVIECIKLKKFVLCEKPLAIKLEDIEKIIELEKSSRDHYVSVGFMRRFDPGYIHLKNQIETKELGEVLMTHSIHRNVKSYPSGDSSTTIINSTVHEFDVLTWLLNDDIVEVTWLCGKATSLMTNRHDPQFLVLKTKNKVLHTIEVMVHAQYGYEVNCQVVNEKGILDLMPSTTYAPYKSSNLVKSIAYHPDWISRFEDAYRNELKEWIACTKKRVISNNIATPHDFLQSIKVANALVESMNNNGKKVLVK